jgi:uncharacterized protein YhbP (UPF0306 family)
MAGDKGAADGGNRRVCDGSRGDGARARVYFAKFPFARDLISNPLELGKEALNVKFHVFRPERICYIDNELGFGKRLSLRVENGEASGPPASG